MSASDDPLVPPRIARRASREAGLDVEGLLGEGRAHLRALAATTWTDHNVHDPGITLLESIAYGWTDLAFRATADMPRLLGADGERGFFTAAEMLPCAPTTADDLRRIMLDVPGVRDAVVRPATVDDPRGPDARDPSDAPRPAEPAIHIDARTCRLTTGGDRGGPVLEPGGLLVVELEFEPPPGDLDPSTHGRETALRAEAAFHRNRPLATDLLAITTRPVVPIRICADLDLAAGTDPDRARAAVLLALAHHLEPPVSFRSLDEALAAGHSMEALFTGPLPRHGFVIPAVRPRPSAIHASDLYRIILAVDGVRLVSRLRVVAERPAGPEVDETLGGSTAAGSAGAGSAANDPWLTPIPDGAVPRLDVGGSILRCFVGPVPQPAPRIDLGAEVARLDRRLRHPRLPAHMPARPPAPLEVPPTEAFTSLQETLPLAYGVGEQDLPPDASDRRRGQAAQLRAFLLIFDQLRADFGARLDAAPRLLSVRPPDFADARPAGACDTVPGYGDVMSPLPAGALDALLTGDSPTHLARIEARLAHLLARHGDGFGDHEYALRGAAVGGERVADLARLLEGLDRTSHDRGRGVDQLAEDPPAPALVERLIARLGLGRGPYEARPELQPHRAQVYRDVVDRWRFRFEHDDGDIVLRSAFSYARVDAAWTACRETVLRAQRGAEAIRRLEPGAGRLHAGFAIDDGGGASLAYSTDHFDPPAREAAIERLVAAAREMGDPGPHVPLLPDALSVEVYRAASGSRRYRLVGPDGDIVLRSTRGWETVAELDEAIEAMVRQGADPAHFAIADFGDHHRLRLPDPDGAGLLAAGTERFDTAEQAASRRDMLADALRDALADRAPQVIEHILLRPRRTGARIMAHAPCSRGDGCHVDDPYSHRLTVLLPAWPEMFVDLRRRAAAEQIVRSEAPAHLAVRICWVDERTAFLVRRATQRLFDSRRAALGAPSPASLAEWHDDSDHLVILLEAIRSIYPEARLHDCEQPHPEGAVLLDHSRLGALHVHRE